MKRKGSVNTRFPLARIKKIIQKNEEIGKIAHSVPFLVAKGLEHFLEQILKKVQTEFPDQNEKLAPSHLKHIIKKEPNYEFLTDLFREVPDLEDLRGKKTKVGKRKMISMMSENYPEDQAIMESQPTKKLKADTKSFKNKEEQNNNVFFDIDEDEEICL